MAHKYNLLMPAVILAASLAAATAFAGPGRAPAVEGPPVIAENPSASSILKQQAEKLIGNNSLNEQLTMKSSVDTAVNREPVSPKRTPAVAPAGGGPSTSMNVQ